MVDVAIVSFRLGARDGVSIEAAKWEWALRSLGHRVATVAGEGVADVMVPGLAMDASSAPTPDELVDALHDADLVVVENLASLPLNPTARDTLYDVLEDRAALFHHHDLAWQRDAFAYLDGPRDRPLWRHVTINELSRRELAARGIVATTMMNSFDCDPPDGDRAATREALGLSDQRVALMATRAIPRKNVAGALALCAALDATLWLLGPSEEGYEDELEILLRDTGVDSRRGLPGGLSVHDAYAASDLVVMASTWEGFGNPVLESVTHRRALALNLYPVAEEIVAHGFEFFGLDDARAIDAFLDEPDSELFERNLAIARRDFNLTALPGRLASLLTQWGFA